MNGDCCTLEIKGRHMEALYLYLSIHHGELIEGDISHAAHLTNTFRSYKEQRTPDMNLTPHSHWVAQVEVCEIAGPVLGS